jgi:hypothetical protein
MRSVIRLQRDRAAVVVFHRVRKRGRAPFGRSATVPHASTSIIFFRGRSIFCGIAEHVAAVITAAL